MERPRIDRRAPSRARRYRLVFLAILAVWLVFPLMRRDVGQDVVPFSVAGKLVLTDPSSVYLPADATSMHEVNPVFRAASCRYYPTTKACDDYVVGFISSPLALPLVVPLGWLGSASTFVMRLVGYGAFVAAMLLLWKRLIDRDENAGLALVITAALLTPLVSFTVGIAQNSPFLFLGAMLPVTALNTRWRRAGGGLVIVATAALKVWPAASVGIVVAQRRWRLLGWIAASCVVLAVITLLLGGSSLVGDFVDTSRAVGRHTASFANNGSLDAALYRTGLRGGAIVATAWLIRFVAVVPLARAYLKTRDENAKWSFTWLAALLFFPYVWAHYLFVGVAAVAAATAAAPAPGRRIWLLPASAGVVVVAGLVSEPGSPLIQFGALAALLVTTWSLLAVTPRRTDPEPSLVAAASS